MTDSTSNCPDPYSAPESPSKDSAEPPNPADQTLATFPGRITLLLLACISHVFCWAMLLTWTWGSLSGQLQWPTLVRDLTMYVFAFVCIMATSVVIYSVVRRLNVLTLMATAISVGSFGVLILADWYG